MNNQTLIKQPFVIIKNYRSLTKEKNEKEKKKSNTINQQQATIKKKPKTMLESEREKNILNKRDVDNQQQMEIEKGKEMEEEYQESYDKVNLEQVIPMQFSNNLRKQSLLDQSPPHSREYSPAMKGLKGSYEDEDNLF